MYRELVEVHDFNRETLPSLDTQWYPLNPLNMKSTIKCLAEQFKREIKTHDIKTRANDNRIYIVHHCSTRANLDVTPAPGCVV